MIFISHDLAVMEYISDRIAVLYLGKLMEIGPAREIISNPKHPYIEALVSAVPDPTSRRKRIILRGEAPSPPSGCVFRTRCAYALPDCALTVPDLREISPGHAKACIRDDVL
jgi:oligopeptide transport system ATP-binding protein